MMDVNQGSFPDVNSELPLQVNQGSSEVIHESFPEIETELPQLQVSLDSPKLVSESIPETNPESTLQEDHESYLDEKQETNPEEKQESKLDDKQESSIPDEQQELNHEEKQKLNIEGKQEPNSDNKEVSNTEDASPTDSGEDAPTDLSKRNQNVIVQPDDETKPQDETGTESPWDGVLEPECNIEESNEEIMCPQPEYDPQEFVHHLTTAGYYGSVNKRKTRRTSSKSKTDIHCVVPFPLYKNFETLTNKEALEMRSNQGLKCENLEPSEDNEPARKKVRRSLRRARPEEEGFAEIFNDPDSDCYMSDKEDKANKPEGDDDDDSLWTANTLPATVPSIYGIGKGWSVAGQEEVAQPSPQFTSSTGLKKDLSEKSILDVFFSVFTIDIMDLIITETNRYHAQHPAHVTSSSHTESWADLTRNDLLMFLTLLTLTGHHSTDKLRELWTKKYFLEYPFFRSCMPRDRFFSILSYLHFCDNKATPSSDRKDQAWKIRPLLNMLLQQFKSLYDPLEHLVLDNVVVRFKGRIVFRRQVPKQKSQGILRLWKLVDSKSYTYDVLLSTEQEKSWNPDADVLPHKLVTDLTTRLQNKGHTLFTDCDFTSPELFRELKSNGFHAVGVAKGNCAGMPDTLSSNLQQGEIRYRRNGHLLAMAWKEKGENVVLSTIHGGQDDGFYQSKGSEPPCLHHYKKFSGYVEKGNKLVNAQSYVRNTWKWTKKIFFHLFDLSILNCRVLYGLADGSSQMLSLRDFRLALIEQLLALLTSNAARPMTPTTNANHGKLSSRLDGAQNRHWPEINERRAADSNQHRSKECVVCKSRRVRRKSTFHCGTCKANLCPHPCFKIYHTQIDYSLMENG